MDKPNGTCCDCYAAEKAVRTEHRIGGGYLYRPNQLIAHEDDVERVEAALKDERALVVGRVPIKGTRQVRLELEETAPAVPKLIQAIRPCDEDADDALRVSPNHVMVGAGHPLAFPGGPPSPAPALPVLAGGAGGNAKVAILDTGVMSGHPWFGNRATASPLDQEAAPNGGPLGVYAGHGTFIAGVVLKEAPAAVLHIEKAFSSEEGISDDQVADRLAGLPSDVDVVCLSFGAYTHGDRPLPAVTDAVRALMQRARQPVVVAAAGNEDRERRMWPAAVDGVIAVAATDGNNGKATFSSYGPWVDAAARGKDVHSTFFEGHLTPAAHDGHPAPTPQPFSGFAHWSGTSFAAPWVAGRIAASMTSSGPGAARSAAGAVLAAAIGQSPLLGAILTP